METPHPIPDANIGESTNSRGAFLSTTLRYTAGKMRIRNCCQGENHLSAGVINPWPDMGHAVCVKIRLD